MSSDGFDELWTEPLTSIIVYGNEVLKAVVLSILTEMLNVMFSGELW